MDVSGRAMSSLQCLRKADEISATPHDELVDVSKGVGMTHSS